MKQKQNWKATLISTAVMVGCIAALGLATYRPAMSQLIYNNTFPFWNVNGPLTVSGATSLQSASTVGLTNTGLLTTGTLNTTGAYTPTGGISGVTTSSVAAAGIVGEMLSAIGPGNGLSAVALSSTTPAGIVCKALTAGDWNVQGTVGFSATAATFTKALAGITNNATSAVVGALGTYTVSLPDVSAVSDISAVVLTTPVVPLQLNTTTTYCATAQGNFGGTAAGAYAVINARRVR